MTRNTVMSPVNFVLLCFILLSARTVHAQDTGCFTVNFETIPGEQVAEGLLIDTQFESDLGISFVLEDGTVPRLAEIGTPTTAFEPRDTPEEDQGIGSFFLTDDGELTSGNASPLIVTFSQPVDSAGGVVLDIDFTETFTIEARDNSEQVLEQIIITAGDDSTGDGIATPWSFAREMPDVASIRFEGVRPSGRFGLGFDNFTTCAPARSTAVEAIDLPATFSLGQNYPNPFNPSTTIAYEVFETSHVRLEVYSMNGRQLTVLVNQTLPPGRYQVQWIPKELTSGTYLYQMIAGNLNRTRLLTLLK